MTHVNRRGLARVTADVIVNCLGIYVRRSPCLSHYVSSRRATHMSRDILISYRVIRIFRRFSGRAIDISSASRSLTRRSSIEFARVSVPRWGRLDTGSRNQDEAIHHIFLRYVKSFVTRGVRFQWTSNAFIENKGISESKFRSAYVTCCIISHIIVI